MSICTFMSFHILGFVVRNFVLTVYSMHGHQVLINLLLPHAFFIHLNGETILSKYNYMYNLRFILLLMLYRLSTFLLFILTTNGLIF